MVRQRQLYDTTKTKMRTRDTPEVLLASYAVHVTSGLGPGKGELPGTMTHYTAEKDVMLDTLEIHNRCNRQSLPPSEESPSLQDGPEGSETTD